LLVSPLTVENCRNIHWLYDRLILKAVIRQLTQ
jgi:hypothetical protein